MPRFSSPASPTGATWRGFVRGALGTGVAVGVRAVGALVLSKLMAVYGGPGGLTQLAQFQSLMGLFGALPADGIQVGATTRLAPLRPGTTRYRAWLGAALAFTLGAVGCGGVVLGLVGGAAWPLGPVALFTLGMAAVASQALLSTALLAAGQRRAYVVQALVLSALSVAAAGAALGLGRPLPQVLAAYLLGQAVALLPTLVQARRAGLLRGLRPGRPSPAALRGLRRFVLMASGSLLFGRAVDYAVRAYLIGHFAPAATDLWQAVGRLSDYYSLVVGAVLSTVFYPRLAALAAVPSQARHYLWAILGLLAGGLAVGFSGVFGAARLALATAVCAAPAGRPRAAGSAVARRLGQVPGLGIYVSVAGPCPPAALPGGAGGLGGALRGAAGGPAAAPGPGRRGVGARRALLAAIIGLWA